MIRGSVTSVVVAGGRANRFGRDKLAEKLGSRTLLQRVVEAVRPLSNDIVVAVARGQSVPDLPDDSLEIVADLYPNKSALGGIYTGLVSSRSFYNLVVACDMPFLNVALLRHMIRSASGYDVVIPRIEGMLEPLHAIYSKNCVGLMQRQIDTDELRIRVLLSQVKVRYVEEGEVDRLDPQRLSFFNVNTKDDLSKARALLEQHRASQS